MWLEEQTTVWNPALRSGRPMDKLETGENQGRDGGKTYYYKLYIEIVSLSYVQLGALNGWNWTKVKPSVAKGWK